MADYDAVIVGSGINSLVAAALLAKAGWRVCMLEKNNWFGGAIKTQELTQPDFRHDVFSSWHPLFTGSDAYRVLGDDLRTQGLEYLNTTSIATGALRDDSGTSAFLYTSHERNVEEMNHYGAGDGVAWDTFFTNFMGQAGLIFGFLSAELWSRDGLGLALKAHRQLRTKGLLQFSGTALASARDWLTGTFSSPEIYALLAPWVLHTGLGPESTFSGIMLQVIAAALELGGMPVPKGGGARLVDAFVRLIQAHGGHCRTEAYVTNILVKNRQAYGVRLQSGETVTAEKAVICNVTPTQLYLHLLDASVVPAELLKAAQKFRYGRSAMQIHMALSEPPQWSGDERLIETPIVHVTPGLNGVSRAVNEAERGLLPAEATIVCGQPLVVDPSRAPAGRWIIWIQLQELPVRPKGDAAADIDTGAGTWTPDLRERYADRIQARLERHIPNLSSALMQRVVLSPADLEAANINLVNGDPYSGACTLDQNLLWRPLAGQPGHQTPIRGLYHIGASTHPGPGLGGGSGSLVAKQLLTKRRFGIF